MFRCWNSWVLAKAGIVSPGSWVSEGLPMAGPTNACTLGDYEVLEGDAGVGAPWLTYGAR